MNQLRAYWYCPTRQGEGDFENFGDRIAPEIIEFLSLKAPRWTNPRNVRWYSKDLPVYLTVGSIIKRSTKHCSIWGSGIKEEKKAPKGFKEVHCVRGPLSRKFLMAHGYSVPEVYGDPGLLLPFIYPPVTDPSGFLGVIPHYVDFEKAKRSFADVRNVKVIDLCAPVRQVIADITSCRVAISSSLHGIITSHAYGIPCVQVEFSSLVSGSGIKFKDYFQSVTIPFYEPFKMTDFGENHVFSFFEKIILDELKIAVPDPKTVRERQQDLLQSCPFLDDSLKTLLSI